MLNVEDERFIEQDRQDLCEILAVRFGNIPNDVIQQIDELKDLNQLQRLILVACNSPSFKVFIEELGEPNQSFKLTGERFNPIRGN